MRLVGRDHEVASFDRLLARAADGPAGLVLEGEAGIGKSILLEHAERAAHERGFAVLRTQGTEAEAGWSLLPLADLLGEVPEQHLARLPAPQRHAMDVVRRHAEPGDRPVDQGTIAAGLRSVIGDLAAEQPLLLVVDDEHWLDAATAAVLGHVVRRLRTDRVGLLTARRTPEPSVLELARLLPDGAVEVLRVPPLTLGALRPVLEERLGVPVSRATLTRIHEAARGNPLFAVEIGKVLVATGVPPIGEPLPVPDDVQELIRRRVAGLSAETRGTLLRLALGPGSGGVPLGSLDEPAAEHLTEAAAAGVVLVEARTARFAHPFHAAAVIAGATDEQRRVLRRELAAKATAVDDRARYLASSTTGPDEDVAAALEKGAAAAAARGAPVDAAHLLVRAFELTPPAGAVDAERRGLGAGARLLQVGEIEAALAVLDGLAGRGLTPAGRAEVLRLRAEECFIRDDYDAGVRLLDEALALHPDTHLAALDLIAVRSELGDFDGARRVAEETIARLEAEGDAPLLAQALAYLAMAQHRAGTGIDWNLVERALALEDPERVPPNFDRPRTLAAYLTAYCGRFDEARALLREEQQDQELAGIDDGEIDTVLAWLEMLSGDFEQAAVHLDHGRTLSDLASASGLFLSCTSTLAVVEALRGRRERVAELLAEVGEHEGGRAGIPKAVMRARLALALAEGRHDDAWAAAEEYAERIEHDGLHPTLDLWSVDAVEAAAASGHAEHAERLAASWEERAAALGYPWVGALAARCRAVVRAHGGDLAAAVEACDEALVLHDEAGMAFNRARVLLLKGTCERRLRRWSAARATLTEAVAELERLGAAVWATRARDELERIGTRSRSDGSLTPSEQRVVELAVEGLRNKEIATALSVSVHTVERHLSNAFTKLGVTRRAQLATRLATPPEGR
ncbi:MAG TPA: AAA family ATPase [Nocardioides sp.]|nr:AAA family ATPase [Nocardioides sp.]